MIALRVPHRSWPVISCIIVFLIVSEALEHHYDFMSHNPTFRDCASAYNYGDIMSSLLNDNRNSRGSFSGLRQLYSADHERPFNFSDVIFNEYSLNETDGLLFKYLGVDFSPAEYIDIVVPLETTDTAFFESWRPFIEAFHVIIVYHGSSSNSSSRSINSIDIVLPGWLHFELYTMEEVNESLGDASWVVSHSPTSAMVNFAHLISDKEYVFQMDPRYKISKGERDQYVNPITHYFLNLLFHSQLIGGSHHPGGDGGGGGGGGRSSSRRGLSHAMGGAYPVVIIISEDVYIRQLKDSKTAQQQLRYLQFQFAANKAIFGPVLLQGLVPDHMPYVHHDRVLCSWAAEVVLNHIGARIKWRRGAMADGERSAAEDYIRAMFSASSRSSSEANCTANIEMKFLSFMLSFFDEVQLNHTKDSAMAYLDLAAQLQAVLATSPFKQYMSMAYAMRTWSILWHRRHGSPSQCLHPENRYQNANCSSSQIIVRSYQSSYVQGQGVAVRIGHGITSPNTPNRNSSSSHHSQDERNRDDEQHSSNTSQNAVKRCAVLTAAHNEGVMLPIWARYYSQYFNASDMWVLNYNSLHDIHDDLKRSGLHVMNVVTADFQTPLAPPLSNSNNKFVVSKIEKLTERLLRFGYGCVLLSQPDEIVAVAGDSDDDGDDDHHHHTSLHLNSNNKGGINSYLDKFLSDPSRLFQRALGVHLCHVSTPAVLPTAESGSFNDVDGGGGGGGRSSGDRLLVEPAMNWSEPLLTQRKVIKVDELFNKNVLTKVPLRYTTSFYDAFEVSHGQQANQQHEQQQQQLVLVSPKSNRDESLLLIHLQFADANFCDSRLSFQHHHISSSSSSSYSSSSFPTSSNVNVSGEDTLHSYIQKKQYSRGGEPFAPLDALNYCEYAHFSGLSVPDHSHPQSEFKDKELALIPDKWKRDIVV